ncbi:hypothetical protein [Sphingosinicella soli]|uniref:alpha/beta hydrolase n=1 Tax=Sphingosinicella soli TaxID=333708 RepID=UPI00311CA9CA
MARYGGDPERISLSGHSAGGHLAMELLFTDWVGSYGLPEDVIKSVLSISGLYDLRPLRASYVQSHLDLSESDAVRLSPLLHVRPTEVPVTLAVASNDPAGFHDQLDDMVKALCRPTSEQVLHVPADHLSILDALVRPDGTLLKHVLTHMVHART